MKLNSKNWNQNILRKDLQNHRRRETTEGRDLQKKQQKEKI
jgi:hypothetical protein